MEGEDKQRYITKLLSVHSTASRHELDKIDTKTNNRITTPVLPLHHHADTGLYKPVRLPNKFNFVTRLSYRRSAYTHARVMGGNKKIQKGSSISLEVLPLCRAKILMSPNSGEHAHLSQTARWPDGEERKVEI